MVDQVTIARRFNGPEASANGGYAAGVMFEAAGGQGPWSVGLKAPPPLGIALDMIKSGEKLEMKRGDQLIADIAPAGFDHALPDFQSFYDYDASQSMKEGPQSFGYCFVCGRERQKPDALCIHAHPVKGHSDYAAAPWQLHDGLSDDGQFVADRYLVSALDCPGYFACAAGEPALLARITVEKLADLPASGDVLVAAWGIGETNSRKRQCGTAIIDKNGKIYARAEALWVVVTPKYLAQIANAYTETGAA